MQKQSLFQGAKEMLAGHGIFDSTQVILGASAHDKLGVVLLVDGRSKSDEIAPVIERLTRAAVLTMMTSAKDDLAVSTRSMDTLS